MSQKTLLSWSTGKDSAWTLQVLRCNPNVDVIGLFCTVNTVFNRVTMHGVRSELLMRQAESIGLLLHVVDIPYPCNHAEYQTALGGFIRRAKGMGVECFAFGDLFLESVRQYRESLLHGTGITPLFPLWGSSTQTLSRQMVAHGLKAVITCSNAERFTGREYDASFLADIPEGTDPCGENGEFHTFAWDGPMFQYPIHVQAGETVNRYGVYFTDFQLQS